MWPLVRFVAITMCILIIPVKTALGQDCKFTWENDTDITDIDFGINLDRILDTELPGTKLISIKTTDVVEIMSYTNSTPQKPYMEPTLNGNRLVLELTEFFLEYEENEISNEMTITVTFKCLKGTSKKIRFIQPIEDTNNHSPEFMDENDPTGYVYTLPMPFPKNFQLSHLPAISARDIDITNANISFYLDPEDTNIAGFSVNWLSRDTIDRKRYHAALVTKATIDFANDVTFSLYATDAGNPPRTSSTKVTIRIDRENSILRFNRPLFTADLTNLVPDEANGKVIEFAEGAIALASGADKTVEFAIRDDLSDYEKNFVLTIADDRSSVSIRLIDPQEKFFSENFVVLSLTAKKSSSEETTVVHISLPGRVSVPGSTSTTLPTTESSDCKFTWENDTDITDIDFGINLDRILDTELPGTKLISIKTTDVVEIISYTNSTPQKPYMEPTLNGSRLVLELTEFFLEYEENEISNEMTTTVTFKCLKGTSKKIRFIQPIEDTNNHSPEFMDENDPTGYVYTLPMPFPKNFQLSHLPAISARDIDITNANISFYLDPEDANIAGFSVNWLSRDTIDRKRYHAALVTKATIDFANDVTFSLYATDAGNPPRTSSTKVTIRIDRENSILRFNRPLFTADLTNLVPEEANGKVIEFAEGAIALASGADKTVEFAIRDDLSDYEKNFDLTIADDRSSVSIRLIDPQEKFFSENFVVLSLTAKKSSSEETTVVHISLPGRVSVPGSSSTTLPTTKSSGYTNAPEHICSTEQDSDSIYYVVAVVVLAILLLVAIVGLVIFVLKLYSTRRKLFNVEHTVNGEPHTPPEMG